MNGSERLETTKGHSTPNARRVSEHRLRQRARAEILRRLMEDPAIRAKVNALVNGDNALAEMLGNDPLFLADVSQQSALMRYEQANPVANAIANVHQVSSGALAKAPPAPITVAPTGPPAPPTGVPSLSPSPQQVGIHEHWDALASVCGEAKTPPAKNKRGKAVKDLKEAGYTPADIIEAAGKWKSRMGDVLMTDMSMVVHIGQCLNGPALGKQTQYLNETATLKHQPKLHLE